MVAITVRKRGRNRYRDLVDGPCPGSYLPEWRSLMFATTAGLGHGALVTVHCRPRIPAPSPKSGRHARAFGGGARRSCVTGHATKRPSSPAVRRELAQGFDGLCRMSDAGLRVTAGALIWFLKWNLFNFGGVAAIGGHRWREV